MNKPKIGIVALQGDIREHETALAGAGAMLRRVRAVSDLPGLDGLVVPGGESTTIGKLAASSGLLDPIRALVRAGLPVYGSCAGLVLLADRVVDGLPGQPLIGGLDVTVRRNAFGRQVASFEAQLRIPALGGPPVHGVFIRAPWVEQAGAGVEILGVIRAPDGADRIVAVRQGGLLATSFHPELTPDRRIHEFFVAIARGQA